MEKIYKLNSRGKENNYLKLMPKSDGSESKTYLLKTEIPYLRAGFLDDKRFYVEPSGGPMLIVGDKIPELGVIKSIDFTYRYGYFITFE